MGAEDDAAMRVQFQTFGGEMPRVWADQLFRIEVATFGQTYARCPRSREEFDARYSGRRLLLVVALVEGTVIGHRVFQMLSERHVESMFMVVRSEYRGHGIASGLCAVSSAWLAWLGAAWISSWTHVDITAAEIMAKYAPIESTSDRLTSLERRLRGEVEQHDGRVYGNSRTVSDFYEMLDGRSGDARYWVHRLDKPGRPLAMGRG